MTTQSGYELKITLWAPCHPNEPESMDHANALIGHVKDMLATPDILDHATVLIGKREWRQRRKIAAESGHDSVDPTQPTPEPVPSSAVSGGAPSREECEANQAGMDMPSFLRRPTKREE